MPTITVQVPDDLKKRMDAAETVNWSAVARLAFEKQLTCAEQLAKLQELTKNSTMTEEDAIELGRLVNKGLAERYRKYFEEKAAKSMKKSSVAKA